MTTIRQCAAIAVVLTLAAAIVTAQGSGADEDRRIGRGGIRVDLDATGIDAGGAVFAVDEDGSTTTTLTWSFYVPVLRVIVNDEVRGVFMCRGKGTRRYVVLGPAFATFTNPCTR